MQIREKVLHIAAPYSKTRAESWTTECALVCWKRLSIREHRDEVVSLNCSEAKKDTSIHSHSGPMGETL